MPKSYLERITATIIENECLPMPVEEFRFCEQRRWRFDFCWPDKKVALEVEGAVWSKNGRHTSGKGYTADCEKYNFAILDGWKLIRVTKLHIINGQMIAWLKKALEN